jgi:hypothetical protein
MGRQRDEITVAGTLSGLPPGQADWSDREGREIARIRAACADHPPLELEGGRTDEGDPWLIVCAHEPGRECIVLHLARIDRCYVIVLPRLYRLDRTVSLTHAVDTALRELAHHRAIHQRSSHRPYLAHRSGG